MELLKKSQKAQGICLKQWANAKAKTDPCDNCPLCRPCILGAVVTPGIEPFNKWINCVNLLAEQL
jgi:hypothetical protein